MGKQFEALTEQQIAFIEQQKLFFVGTAADTGTVNVSPKGMDSLRVLDNRTVAWLNLTGSGNESAAHVQINPRMTIMFCAFEGTPLILRLYGQARALHASDKDWERYAGLFPEMPGSRQIFLLSIDKTQNSCGTSVPLYDYREDRETLKNTLQRWGKSGTEAYWEKKNQHSIDGFPTHIMRLSGVDEVPKDE